MRYVKEVLTKTNGFVGSLLILSLFAVSLSIYRIIATDSSRYWFLVWNLFLAWLPLIFAWALYKRTPKGLTWSLKNFILFIVWLIFLPNAFYLITDYIHLRRSADVGLMYDVVLISTYVMAGIILGFSSLYLVHIRAMQRFAKKSHLIILGSLLLSGFAIYLGRYLRWNSWDIIVNPFGIVFDLTDNLINPGEHVLGLATTMLFFTFLSVIYFVIYNAIKSIPKMPKDKVLK